MVAHSPNLPSQRTTSFSLTDNINGKRYHWEECSPKANFSFDPSSSTLLPLSSHQPIIPTFEKSKKPPHPQYIDGEVNLLSADHSCPFTSPITLDISHKLPLPSLLAPLTNPLSSENNPSSLPHPHNFTDSSPPLSSTFSFEIIINTTHPVKPPTSSPLSSSLPLTTTPSHSSSSSLPTDNINSPTHASKISTFPPFSTSPPTSIALLPHHHLFTLPLTMWLLLQTSPTTMYQKTIIFHHLFGSPNHSILGIFFKH